MKINLKANEISPAIDKELTVNRVDFCRSFLYVHGFLTEADNDRITTKIEKWAAEYGMARRKPIISNQMADT